MTSWLAFAVQKLDELRVLGAALNGGRASVRADLEANQAALVSRQTPDRVTDPAARAATAQITPDRRHRTDHPGPGTARQPVSRAFVQAGSGPRTSPVPDDHDRFLPQTTAIRRIRRQFRVGELERSDYQAAMRAEIESCIRKQEDLGLDVLVHGEAERNDMAE
ncbi:MAG: hypothetical protein ACK5LN_01695 [Propioniciclava sp.]